MGSGGHPDYVLCEVSRLPREYFSTSDNPGVVYSLNV